MYTFISILIVIVAVLLVLIVLVQNSKGGGLSATFGGSNQVMGVRRTADFLEKATWTLAAVLLGLSIMASWAIKKPETGVKSRMEQQVESSEDFEDDFSAPAGLPIELPADDE